MIDKPLVFPLQEQIDYAFFPRVPEVSLELTANCNLKCPYCANGTLTRPKAYIDWSLLEKIVDECAERKFNLAWLHGVGEPLLWDRLEEVITLIKRKNAGKGSFGTNGVLLNENRIRRLLDAGLESIYVSIDTLDPAVYKSTRGGKLQKVIDNIQSLLRMAPRDFKITVALMNHRDHQITQDTLIRFEQTFGKHENLVTNLVENSFFPGAQDYRVESGKKNNSCFSPVNFLFIASDGRAAICCIDQDVRYSLGNVTERSIHDIWYSSETQTTFRNLALGIFSCPPACVNDCVLSPPKQNVNAATLGYALPFDQAALFADILSFNGERAAASHILTQLITRDPLNNQLRHVLNEWRKTAAPPAASSGME